MSAGAGAQWSGQYESVKRALLLRRSTGVPLSREETQGHSMSLDRLQEQLRLLSAAPQPGEHGLPASELARREVLVDNLRTLILKGQLPSSSSGRSSFGGGAAAAAAAGGPSVVYNPAEVSNKGLSVQREQVLKEQDDILSQIGAGVDRLFMQAVAIGEETSVHSRLLDSLDDHVEVTQRALKEEAKHAEVIREKSRTFYLYLCIAVEVAVLVVLVAFWAMRR